MAKVICLRAAVVASALTASTVLYADEGGSENAGERGAAAIFSTQSELSVETLERRGLHGLGDLVSGAVASLQVEPGVGSAAALNLTLRGVGGTTPTQVSGDPSVAVFSDGVYLGRAQGLSLDLLDIERLTVLHGPQGSRYGRNTLGGAVELVTKKPSGKFSLKQQLTVGAEYDELRSVTHLDLPQFAGVSAKLSHLTRDHNGWLNNPNPTNDAGINNFRAEEEEGLRLALHFDFGDALVADYVYEDRSLDDAPSYFQIADSGSTGLAEESRRVDTAREGLFLPLSSTELASHRLTVEWQLGDQLSLTSISSQRELDTMANANFGGALTATPSDSVDSTAQAQQQWSQEFRLSGQLASSLNYQAGVHYLDEEATLQSGVSSESVAMSDDYRGDTELESLSVYARADLALSETLQLSVGLRETSDKKTSRSLRRAGGDINQFATLEDDNTDYHIALSVAINDQLDGSLRYASGFKAGGASLLASALDVYGAESMATLELGLQGQSGSLDWAIAAFSSNYQDQQLVFVDAANPLLRDIRNADEDSTIEGLELDAQISPLDGLSLALNYRYLDSEIAPPSSGGDVLLVPAPRHAATFAIDYRLGRYEFGTLRLHADYIGSSARYFDTSYGDSDSRDLLNARLIVSDIAMEDDSGTLQLSLWVKNLQDEEYVVNSLVGMSGSTLRAYGEPRSYGVDVLYNY